MLFTNLLNKSPGESRPWGLLCVLSKGNLPGHFSSSAIANAGSLMHVHVAAVRKINENLVWRQEYLLKPNGVFYRLALPVIPPLPPDLGTMILDVLYSHYIFFRTEIRCSFILQSFYLCFLITERYTPRKYQPHSWIMRSRYGRAKIHGVLGVRSGMHVCLRLLR